MATEGETTQVMDRSTGNGAEERSPAQIQAEIDTTRHEMGDTVAAIADKADVKKHAKRKAAEVRQKASDNAAPIAAVAAAAGLVVIGWLVLRR
jgi:5-enolpyruvylshikimate-3-phosphate synthase